MVPLLKQTDEISSLLTDAGFGESAHEMASLITESTRGEGIGVKTVLRMAERAVATASLSRGLNGSDSEAEHDLETTIILEALRDILEDFLGDEATASSLCEVIL